MQTAKKIFIICLSLFIAAPMMAQKLKNKQFKSKLRLARKEARQYEKDGWYTAPGDMPLEKQFERSFAKEVAEDEYGFPKFYTSSGSALAGTQSAAKLQASELAKLDLVGQMSAQIAATIDNQIANNQLNQEEAVTVQKTVASAKNILSTRLGTTVGLIEMYRDIEETKNVECEVRIAYSRELAEKMAKEVLRQELEKEAMISTEKLDKVLDF